VEIAELVGAATLVRGAEDETAPLDGSPEVAGDRDVEKIGVGWTLGPPPGE